MIAASRRLSRINPPKLRVRSPSNDETRSGATLEMSAPSAMLRLEQAQQAESRQIAHHDKRYDAGLCSLVDPVI